MPPSGTGFDVIVVGGGTIGLSAAYHAATRGLRTLLLEQFPNFGDGRASSGGASRIFRLMHSPSHMVQLAEVALALWQEIEAAAEGVEILWKQPLIFYGDPSEPTVEGDLGDMPRILADLGLPYSWFGAPAGLMKQYRAFKTIPDNYVGLVQPNSAVIRADVSIATFTRLAAKAGATLVVGQQADVTATAQGEYQVTCPAGTYTAPRLVLCPGAWTNRLLRAFNIQIDLSIWQTTVGYFKAATDRYDYPLWYEFGSRSRPGEQQRLFYGFPSDEVPGSLKVSADFTNSIYSDPNQCTFAPDAQILSPIGAFVQERFHGIEPTAASASTCLYTMSADGQMILDLLPTCQGVAIFTGDSGRGFKFTPLFGRILVDLVTTGKTSYDINPFSISRTGIIKRDSPPT
jgi:sarcosine oxidase / L-pipecolate oxidase